MAGVHFLELLTEDGMAFDNLFCIAFQLLDAQWLAKRASYMEFNVSKLITGCPINCILSSIIIHESSISLSRMFSSLQEYN
jgi:hypothetical protein